MEKVIVELTIEQKIEVLKLAKVILRDSCSGICTSINVAFQKLKLNDPDVIVLAVDIIPMFTKENALIACKKHKMALPNLNATYQQYWWATGTNSDRPRYTVLNWMISELKKKL